MKLHEFALAPNPRRVRMFLAEKSVTIPTVQVNTRERQQFSDEFVKINPFSVVPVLELDDGTFIGESVAICRYIEALHPAPPLMGRDAKDTAIVEMWNRRAETHGMQAASEAVRNAEPMFADRGVEGAADGFPQIPALVERGRKRLARFFAFWDQQLSTHSFVAGPHFTIADITSFVTIEFARRAEVSIPPECSNVARWHEKVANRPSAKA